MTVPSYDRNGRPPLRVVALDGLHLAVDGRSLCGRVAVHELDAYSDEAALRAWNNGPLYRCQQCSAALVARRPAVLPHDDRGATMSLLVRLAQNTTHRCPITGCVERVPDHQLMCVRHWRLVSPGLRSRLYRPWDSGRGVGTAQHHETMGLAVNEVEARLAASAHQGSPR